MPLKLDKMSLTDLKAFQAEVTKTIAGFDGRRRAEALAAIVATAKAHGFTLADLLGVKPARKRAAVAPKYAHPENRSVTWSGRGRRPKWVSEALDNGKALADLMIAP
jgi:DNA-binding protein H-NS